MIPTLRADAYMTPTRRGWPSGWRSCPLASGVDCGTYRGLLEALRDRREYFKRHGATATDAGVDDAWAIPLSDAEAERDPPSSGSPAGSAARQAARLPAQHAVPVRADGRRGRAGDAAARRGAAQPPRGRASSASAPTPATTSPALTTFTEPLRALLNDVGTSPDFRIVLFTTDETGFSREIAPLAGFYPSVYIGAPWWFLDAPAAVRRFRAAVTETAGFYKTSGFVDDTRALCSIPTRHDMSRRLDASYLAELVIDHQLAEDEAHTIARALVGEIPRSVFRL